MSDMTCDVYKLVDVINPGLIMICATMYSKIKLHKSFNEFLFSKYIFNKYLNVITYSVIRNI